MDRNRHFQLIAFLILVPLLIMKSSLISVSFAPTAEGKVTMIASQKNSTGLKAGAGETGKATLKVNTNIILDGAHNPSPYNKDMRFNLYVDYPYYNSRIDGSHDTIVL